MASVAEPAHPDKAGGQRPKSIENARRCEGITRHGVRKGMRCINAARKGRPYCRNHGGNQPVALAHPNFTDGHTSKYNLLPGLLSDAYERGRADPKLLELHDHVAFVQAQLSTLVRDTQVVWDAAGLTQTGPNPKPAWLMLRDGWEAVLGAKTQADRALATSRFGALINAGAQQDQMTASYLQLMGELRKLVETQTRRDEKLGQFIPLEQVRALVRAVGLAVQEYVADRTVVGQIQARLQDLLRHRPSQTPQPTNGHSAMVSA